MRLRKIVQYQHLLRFGQAQFPGDAGMFDGSERRGSGASVMPADQHQVGMRLGDTCGNGADANFGDQFHRDSSLRIDVFQIVNKLGKIFNGINIVMRRRRDQRNAGNGVTHARDHFIHFVSRQLPSFAGLRALRDLDLQLLRVHQIIGGNAEASGSNLLDGAAAPIAVRIALETRFVFPALARIRSPADAVHRDGQRLVRFLAK